MLRGYVFAVEDMLQRFARFYEVEARWDIVTDVLLFRI